MIRDYEEELEQALVVAAKDWGRDYEIALRKRQQIILASHRTLSKVSAAADIAAHNEIEARKHLFRIVKKLLKIEAADDAKAA
jgi:hypothetical protein